MKKILLIDNHDSFVFNIYHMLKQITKDIVDIYPNDNIPFNQLHDYNRIVISPGPGTPEKAGSLMELLKKTEKSHSILGICLGLQAIAIHFGARLFNLTSPLHGHSSTLTIVNKEDPLIGSLCAKIVNDNNLKVGLYHSWAVQKESLPSFLKVGSVNEHGNIMSLFHKSLPIYGVQFHPESIMTPKGHFVISKWSEIRPPSDNESKPQLSLAL
jgi:anthranilate synthase component II